MQAARAAESGSQDATASLPSPQGAIQLSTATGTALQPRSKADSYFNKYSRPARQQVHPVTDQQRAYYGSRDYFRRADSSLCRLSGGSLTGPARSTLMYQVARPVPYVWFCTLTAILVISQHCCICRVLPLQRGDKWIQRKCVLSSSAGLP